MRIDGVDIEAVFGCVPANAVDNLAALEPLVGAEKAAAIVQATGFTTRRVAASGTDVFNLVLPAAKRALEGVASRENNIVTTLGETEGTGFAYAAGGSSNQCNFLIHVLFSVDRLLSFISLS